MLAAPDDETLADILAERIPADPGNARLLAKYLKRIVVRVIHLHDFKPSKTKVEKGDIETVVGEFRKFLETAVDGGRGRAEYDRGDSLSRKELADHVRPSISSL